MDPIALSTYYFVTLGVALLCCLLPSYARCQLHRHEVSKEDQKIVHPNFNLGLSRQRNESKILLYFTSGVISGQKCLIVRMTYLVNIWSLSLEG